MCRATEVRDATRADMGDEERSTSQTGKAAWDDSDDDEKSIVDDDLGEEKVADKANKPGCWSRFSGCTGGMIVAL